MLPTKELIDDTTLALIDDFFQLPNGKRSHTASLVNDIRRSGVWYERYSPRDGMKAYTVLKVEVIEAIRMYLVNSDTETDYFKGYAHLSLSDFLKKMFVDG